MNKCVQLQPGQIVLEVLQAWCEVNAQAIKRCRGLLHGEACATTLVTFFCQPEGARQNPGCLVPKVSEQRVLKATRHAAEVWWHVWSLRAAKQQKATACQQFWIIVIGPVMTAPKTGLWEVPGNGPCMAGCKHHIIFQCFLCSLCHMQPRLVCADAWSSVRQLRTYVAHMRVQAWLTVGCGLQFRQQIGGALAQARQACVEGCSDPFTPGPGETSISQSQLSAAARGV